MADTKNFGLITGGLVADPETIADGKMTKFRLAADFAGYDKDNPDDKSGYFNLVAFHNENDPTTRFITGQMEAGNLKKGSQVTVLYRLKNNRWSQDGARRNSVDLQIEAISYSGNKPPESTADTNGSSEEASSSSPMTEDLPIDF